MTRLWWKVYKLKKLHSSSLENFYINHDDDDNKNNNNNNNNNDDDDDNDDDFNGVFFCKYSKVATNRFI